MLPSGNPARLLVWTGEGWFVAERPRAEDGWATARARFVPERPPIHLHDLVIGARVVGVRSYWGEHLLMQVFRRWRSLWLERGDLLIVQPSALVLISNQSAIPGEPLVKLLTLAHPDRQEQELAQVRRTLERLLGGRRLFGLGGGHYRYDFLETLGIEPLPLSARYFAENTDPVWNHLLLNYPEAIVCLELHTDRARSVLSALSSSSSSGAQVS